MQNFGVESNSEAGMFGELKEKSDF